MKQTFEAPTPEEVHKGYQKIEDKIRKTPVWQWKGDVADELVGPETQVYLKLELFQYGGSFKPRAALMNMMDLSDEQLKKGVTAVSAGNHAIAVAFAARQMNTSAKVVMPKSANKYRVEKCRLMGAQVELVDTVHQAFDRVEEIEKEEGRAFIHPFEGRLTATGTATVGMELYRQAPNLDTVIVPIGGGGLCAGIASFMKQMHPGCTIYGVEPVGADSMSKSLKAGEPLSIDSVDTIADSLGSPRAEPYSFSLCQQYVDEVVLVTDQQLARAMKMIFEELKLAVEPAGASAFAALTGPLLPRIRGQKVGVIKCGTNINTESFNQILEQYL